MPESQQSWASPSTTGIVVVDRGGHIQFWSKSAERLLGFTAAEVIGLRPEQVQPNVAARVRELLSSESSDGTVDDQPLELTHRSGLQISVRISVTPLDVPGMLECYVVLLEDQTEARLLKESLLHYQILSDNTQEIVLFLDDRLHIINANLAAQQFYGYSLEELRQMSIYEIRTEARDAVTAQLASVTPTGLRFEAVHRRRNGREVAVEVTSFAAARRGQRMLINIIRDITGRKRRQAYRDFVHTLDQAVLMGASVEKVMAIADRRSPWLSDDPASGEIQELVRRQVDSAVAQAMRQQRLNTLEAALRATVNGVVITDRAGRIEWINPAVTAITGYTAEEAIGHTPRLFRSGCQLKPYYERMWQTITAGQVWRGEIRNRRKDGSLYDEEMTITPVRDGTGEITHFISIKSDLTQRREREEQIEQLRTTDPITGLMNRSRLLTLLGDLNGGGEEAASIVVFEIDDLPHVNQSLGYEAGERLLVQVAHAIGEVAQRWGLASRIREDEFAMVVWGDSAAAYEAADLVRQRVAQEPFTLSGMTIEVSISAGIAAFQPSTSLTAVQLQAEQALAEAKRMGGNRILVYRSGLTESDDLVQWAAILKQAVRTGGFELHYQPVVRLNGRRSVHVEALIRLRDASGELLSPALFLPTAERLHLISRIDQWVVETVVARLREHPHLQVFINLSGQSLSDMDLLAEIRSLLEREPTVARRITFEITETTAIRNVSAARAWMAGMQTMGVRFALDDFGTGFASFAYLRDLPVDFIKLDGSFVRGLESDPASQAVVRSVVHVAHSMGKTVVAEWVETKETADFLEEMGVEYGQGYGLAMPSPDLPGT